MALHMQQGPQFVSYELHPVPKSERVHIHERRERLVDELVLSGRDSQHCDETHLRARRD